MNATHVGHVVSANRRHHLNPRFLLKRFAEGTDLVEVDRVTGAKKRTTPNRATTKPHFYAVQRDDGRWDQSVEIAIGQQVEGPAAKAIRNLDSCFPPSPSDREAIAKLVAVQLTRGESPRKTADIALEEITRMAVLIKGCHEVRDEAAARGEQPTSAEVRAEAERRYPIDAISVRRHKNEHVAVMLSVAEHAMGSVLSRSWSLARFSNRLLLTSDFGLALIRRPNPERWYEGVGFETAEYIWFPLDPRSGLLFRPGGRTEGIVDLSEVRARGLNNYVAFQSHDSLYHHPAHDPVVGLKLGPRAPTVFTGRAGAR